MPIRFPEDTGHEDMAKEKVRNFNTPHCKPVWSRLVSTKIVQYSLRECLSYCAWRSQMRIAGTSRTASSQ